MWIRSQCGWDIVKAKSVELSNDSTKIKIYGIVDCERHLLGEYEAVRRGLEVMDEIQVHITKMLACQSTNLVYQMPEE